MGNQKKVKNRESFAGVPRVVMRHPDYKNLGYSAKVLLFEMAFLYNGKNNGDISLPFSRLKDRGFKSQGTLSNSIKELINSNLITRTREGYFQKQNSRCALYAINWVAIDDCLGKDLEVSPTRTPVRKFSLENNSSSTKIEH